MQTLYEKVFLAFGGEHLTLALPKDGIFKIVSGKQVGKINEIPGAVSAALRSPIGSPPLRRLVKPGDKVVILASDVTRKWLRHDLFLPVLLDELNAAGVSDCDVTLLAALGAHRRHTEKENVLTYGRAVTERICIVQSCAEDTKQFVSIGKTSRGVPIEIHHIAANADKVILTGGINYHSMAGFSGGRKALLPGISSYASIQNNHRLCLHPESGKGLNIHCACGSLADNEMHQDMMEIAEAVKPDFLLNAVYTAEGDFAAFVAGHWQKAWLAGCKIVEDIYGVAVQEKADLVIASAGGFPKDINFYQASKAIENASLAVKAGGVLIVAMECREIEEPPDFSQWFEVHSLYEREELLRKNFTVPGFVALKLGLIAKQMPVIIVSLPQNKVFLEAAGMIAADNIDEAIALGKNLLGVPNPKTMILPDGAVTLPILQS